MLYALLCYNSEDVVCSWTKEEDDAVMARLGVVHERWERAGKLKPAIRLLPTTAATTLRKADGLVLDGPYAETKEQLLGFYIVDVASLEEGLQFARELTVVGVVAAEFRRTGLDGRLNAWHQASACNEMSWAPR